MDKITIDKSDVPENNDVVALVNKYRQLKALSDKLKTEMDEVKQKIEPIIDEGGNWKDQLGYARRVTKMDTASFDGALDGVAHAWADSTDPVIKAFGDVVLTYRNVCCGSSYIKIK